MPIPGKHGGSLAWIGIALCLITAVGVLAAPPACLAKTKHNAKLVHVASSGLVSYNAWTRKSTVLVHGMMGTWDYPVLSPHAMSAVTLMAFRSDRAYCSCLYASIVSTSATPFELTLSGGTGDVGIATFLGWLDDYRAVFRQMDPAYPEDGDEVTIVRDTHDPGAWSYYNGTVTYPSTGRKKSAGDKKYSIKVSSKQWMTVRVRKTKKRVAHFKVPGSGNGKSETGWYYENASISPDGSFVAYELWRTPYRDARVTWRMYVCTLHGKKAKRLYNGNGGLVWR